MKSLGDEKQPSRNGFLDILFPRVPRNCSSIRYISSSFHSVFFNLMKCITEAERQTVSRSEVYSYCNVSAAS
jgi:hypothetical protein